MGALCALGGRPDFFPDRFVLSRSSWCRSHATKDPPGKILHDMCVYNIYIHNNIREEPAMPMVWGHMMRTILSVRPNCSHRSVSLKKSLVKAVQNP